MTLDNRTSRARVDFNALALADVVARRAAELSAHRAGVSIESTNLCDVAVKVVGPLRRGEGGRIDYGRSVEVWNSIYRDHQRAAGDDFDGVIADETEARALKVNCFVDRARILAAITAAWSRGESCFIAAAQDVADELMEPNR